MKKTKKKGFTLVELIIVIAVIGVLAAILIPVFSNVIKKANSKSALADARNAVSQYVTESLERRLQSLIPIPEQIVLIVEKGGRYYIFGYDTSVTQSVQVSSVNEEGIPATGLQALINSLSWNAHHSENYDPDTTTTYSVDTDGAFYLVPYTGTTPDNPSVRGFVTSTGVSGSFLRLDKEDDEGYGFNLNLGNDTVAFHGCLVNGTYDTESSAPSNNGGSGGGSETASYSVNFTATGIDDGDLANIVYKKGSQVLSNPATLTEGTGVGTLTAECPVTTSAYSYTFTGATASNGHSTIDEADMTITFAFTKVMAQTYNVTYNANGGTGTMTDNTDYLTNAVVTLPENTFTAPEHKHFTGWLINNTGELRAAGYQFNITADTEIYAQWANDAQITVHFNANGGSGTMADDSVYAGSYTLPECSFTKAHHTFNGWKANNEGGILGETYNVTEEVTFYATWVQDTTYTITYDGNGATGGTAPTDSNSYYMNDTATLLEKGTLTYTHKHFTGWKVANGGALLAAGSEYTVTGSVTMYAQWENDATYTVTYDANAGTDTVTGMPSNQTGLYPGSHDLSSATPERDGYTFLGWGATNNATTYITSVTITDNSVTVYAIWEQNAVSGHAVTFNIEYVKYSDATQHWHTSESDYLKTYTKNCVVGENTITYQELVAAGAWAPQANSRDIIPCESGNPSNYVLSWTVSIASDAVTTYDLTIYTRRVNLTNGVQYDANGGEGILTDNNSYSFGDTATALENTFTRTYYNFASWNTNADGSGKTINPGGTFTVAGTVTLYAQWELQPDVVFKTLTYDPNYENGGHSINSTRCPESVTVNRGETVYLSDNCGNTTNTQPLISSVSGRSFIGWNTKADNTGTFYSVESILSGTASLTLMDDTTVYAIYGVPSMSSTTVIYHRNAADAITYHVGENTSFVTYSTEGSNVRADYSSSNISLLRTAYMRPGYYLSGWCISPDGNGAFYPISRTTGSSPNMSYGKSEVHLYAMWKAIANVHAYDISATVRVLTPGISTSSTVNVSIVFHNVLPCGVDRTVSGTLSMQYYFMASVNDVIDLLDAADPGYTHIYAAGTSYSATLYDDCVLICNSLNLNSVSYSGNVDRSFRQVAA